MQDEVAADSTSVDRRNSNITVIGRVTIATSSIHKPS
jgi:hypothetical protein